MLAEYGRARDHAGPAGLEPAVLVLETSGLPLNRWTLFVHMKKHIANYMPFLMISIAYSRRAYYWKLTTPSKLLSDLCILFGLLVCLVRFAPFAEL
jgi:hypothetical protein